MSEEQQHIADLLNVKRGRLRVLELQAARYGGECPAHIILEIEDLRKEIAGLEYSNSKTPISPFINSYLEAMRKYCASLPYLTLQNMQLPRALGDFYIPLSAIPYTPSEEISNDLEDQEPEVLNILDAIRDYSDKHIFILGDPGSGKSTLLRQLAENAWDAPERVRLNTKHLPLLVPLRQMTTDGSIEDRFNRALTGELGLPRKLPNNFFFDWPAQTGTRWLILLDGLDEVSAQERPKLIRWLKMVLDSLEPNLVIITSRPSGYKPGELEDPQLSRDLRLSIDPLSEDLQLGIDPHLIITDSRFRHFNILPFADKQIHDFSIEWFGDMANAFIGELVRVSAGDLLGTPLLLTIAANVYHEKGRLAERRSTLYGQYVDIWLSEAEQQGLKAELGERICKVAKLALAQLALSISEQSHPQDAALDEILAKYFTQKLQMSEDEAFTEALSFLRIISRRSGVFFSKAETYDFIHPTFREYLAALRLSLNFGKNIDLIWEWLCKRIDDLVQGELIIFLLGIYTDKYGSRITNEIVRRICITDKKDIWSNHERLLFAGRCLAEKIGLESEFRDAIIRSIIASMFISGSARALNIIASIDSSEVIRGIHSLPNSQQNHDKARYNPIPILKDLIESEITKSDVRDAANQVLHILTN